MDIKLRRHTLSKDYFIFATVVAFALVLFCIWDTYSTYQSLQEDRHYRYQLESEKVTDALDETFAYIENIMGFIGEKISEAGSNDPKTIASILSIKRLLNEQENQAFFTWTMFDFVLPDGKIIASSTHGVIENPLRVLPEQRNWMQLAPQMPRRLIVSNPDIGLLSREVIIPVGYGVANRDGAFLGTISMGLNVNRLTRKLERALSNETSSFIVLTKDMEFVTRSLNDREQTSSDYFKNKLSEAQFKTEKPGFFEKPIVIGNMQYWAFRYTRGTPFVVLIGENKEQTRTEFQNRVTPRVQQSAIIGFFFLILLYFFQRKIIQPVLLLSKAAIKISKGQDDVSIPDSNVFEYNVLASQLRKIASSMETLRNTRNELEVALNAKSMFLSSMSHELRTPLNAVIGFSETMKQGVMGKLNERYQEYANDIHSSGQYLLNLINQVLDASKFESGMMLLSEETFDVNPLVAECVRQVMYRLEMNCVRIYSNIPRGLPKVYADQVRMKQALLNLLSNAAKFTPPDGKVTIRAYVDTDFIIEVEDTGIGIAEDDLPKVMQRFGQVDNVYTRKQDGTGLGMSITHDIMKLHGGSLEIKSEVSVGTTIRLRLPPDRIRFDNDDREYLDS